MKKRILAFLLSVLMIFTSVALFSFTAAAEEVETSGKLGENIQWKYESRRLIISGSGKMSTLPESLQPWSAFKDSIETVDIREGVTSVCDGAFSKFKNLKVVIIPKTCESVSGAAFAECPSLSVFEVAAENPAYFSNKIVSTNGILYNIDKTEIVRFPTTLIKKDSDSKTFTLPATVNTIGDYAFEGCTYLKEIAFSQDCQLQKIGAHAFENCTSLAEMNFERQADLTAIGDCAFKNSGLKKFTIWNTLDAKKVGGEIFSGISDFTGTFTFLGGTENDLAALNIALPAGVKRAECKSTAYFIRYYDNGGKNGPIFNYILYAGELTISEKTPTSTSGTFRGWADTKDAKNPVEDYNPGKTYTGKKTLRLYAVYSTTYTLTYDANGGTGAPSSYQFTGTSSVKISSVTPSRAGYEFLGWSKDKNAASADANLKPSATVTLDKSITLYAVWDPTGPFDVRFYQDGEKINTDSKEKNVPLKITQTATKEPSSRYEFVGWATTEGSTAVAYKVGDEYTLNKELNLYAVFKDNGPYDVYFVDKYGSTTKKSQSYTGESIAIDVKAAGKEGYTFEGWRASNGTVYKIGDSIVPTSDVTLNAKYKKINVTANTTLNAYSKNITVNYGYKINIEAKATNIPNGYYLAIYDDSNEVASVRPDGNGNASISWTSEPLTSEKALTYTIKITDGNSSTRCTDADGNVLIAQVKVKVESSMIYKILALFRRIFSFLTVPVTKVY